MFNPLYCSEEGIEPPSPSFTETDASDAVDKESDLQVMEDCTANNAGLATSSASDVPSLANASTEGDTHCGKVSLC